MHGHLNVKYVEIIVQKKSGKLTCKNVIFYV